MLDILAFDLASVTVPIYRVRIFLIIIRLDY